MLRLKSIVLSAVKAFYTPKKPSGGLLQAALCMHYSYSLYSTYCTLSATAVCGTKVLLGYLVGNGTKTSNVVGSITMYMSVRRKLWQDIVIVAKILQNFELCTYH